MQPYDTAGHYPGPPAGHAHACAGHGPAARPDGTPYPAQSHFPRQYAVDDPYGPYGATGYGAVSAPAYNAGGWFAFSDADYLKGFFIAAGATLVLTNPGVQRAVIRGAVKVWTFFQGGVEEVKEQFRDVKSEMSQEE